jgi:hypothetical protein
MCKSKIKDIKKKLADQKLLTQKAVRPPSHYPPVIHVPKSHKTRVVRKKMDKKFIKDANEEFEAFF